MTLKSTPPKSPQHPFSIVNQTIAKPRSASAVLYVVEGRRHAIEFVAFREVLVSVPQCRKTAILLNIAHHYDKCTSSAGGYNDEYEYLLINISKHIFFFVIPLHL